MSEMATAMGMEPLPEAFSLSLIKHVLYKNKYQGVEGKQGWAGLTRGIITEREARNLLMAHCATKIASFNRATEPGYDMYSTRELCSNFEVALLGRHVKVTKLDLLDPWEKNA